MKRNERRVIGVASGFATKNIRSKESAKLLTYGVTNFDTIKISSKDSPISEMNVWLGVKNNVEVYTKKNIYKTIPKARKKYLKVTVDYNGPIVAPIKKDDILGKLKILYKKEVIEEHELLAFEDIKKINIFSRLIKSINYLIWGDV